MFYVQADSTMSNRPWVFSKMRQFQQEVKGLPATEGRKLQIIKWLTIPRNLFVARINKSLYSIDEAEYLEYLTENYSKLAGIGRPIITEDLEIYRDLTFSIFGCRCNSYEFLVIHVDGSNNLFIRRKKDSTAIVCNRHWYVKAALLSGTFSPDYRCFIMINVFKHFVFEDVSAEW